MTKLLLFLSPVVTLLLSWFTFLFLIFFPPLWLLWPVMVVFLAVVNYRGIRYGLDHRKKEKPWHYWFSAFEWLLLVIPAAIVW